MCRVHPENQIPSKEGQDDLYGLLEVELGHTYLIRNSSLMHQNMEVLNTSNYFLGMGLQEYIKLDHADLYRACWLESRNRSH